MLLIEPQWGSSVAAMPWPPELLREYIRTAKARGIAVIADEIMCGLGRHVRTLTLTLTLTLSLTLSLTLTLTF